MPEVFKCKHCQAEYDVAYSVGTLETGSRDCDVCGKQMDAWSESRRPVYALKNPAPGGTPGSGAD